MQKIEYQWYLTKMIYKIDAKTTETGTNIYEFHRNDDGTCKTNIIKDFKPYLFADAESPIDKFEEVLKVEYGFTSIENTPLKKVYVRKPDQIKPLRIRLEQMDYKHWEADIIVHNRYNIDMEEDIKPGKLKVCHFDIETNSTDKFPDINIADQEIVSIAAKIDDTMTTWLCGGTDYPGTRYFPQEEDMIEDFLTFFAKESPDIISAWNLDGFDMPYLMRRCKRLGINVKRLSKIRDVWDRKFGGKIYYKIFGTVQIDLLEAYKLWRKYGNLPNLQSYSLDYVARTVLGDKKLEHGKSIGWLWKNDVKTLIDYNRHDVELLDMIDKRCKIIKFFDEIRRKCHIEFEDVYKTTAMIDGFLMNRLKKTIILPTAKRNTEDKFEGAYVFDAKQGIYDNVLCEDIASMYPSIIKNFNISYETVGGGEMFLPLEHPISFSKKTGIIPMFLDELKLERKEYKRLYHEATTDADKELYHQRQFGTKILMNSFFGYLGYPGSRLYKRAVASAITGMGKYLILKIAEWVEENGNKVIYGDTDSVYITATKKEPMEVIIEGVNIMNHINDKLKKLCGGIAGVNYLEIEFEKALKRVLFTDAKKRYAYTLLWDSDNQFDVDKKIHIQGFDAKRSDSNEISKMSQLEVIKMIIAGAEKDDVINYLRGLDKKMRKGGFSDEQIGFPKGITKNLSEYNPPTAMIKGAYYSNLNFNTNYGPGSKPKFVYIKTYNGFVKEIDLNSKTYPLETIAYDTEIPDGFEINWDKMSENTFKKKLIKIFNATKWEWEDLTHRGLFSFEV